MRRFPFVHAMAFAALSLPAVASAHLSLLSPPSRYGPLELKFGPCGITGGTRSGNVMPFDSGETIPVTWDEYVEHDPSHYRISFDIDGDDDFVDPTGFDDYYSDDSVLLDDIPDEAAREQTVMITLPDVECTNCTLQVMQIMEDKPPFGPPGPADDLYYQCADLILTRGSGSGSDAGTRPRDAATRLPDGRVATIDAASGPRDDGPATGGCSVALHRAHASTAAAFSIALLLLILRRRR